MAGKKQIIGKWPRVQFVFYCKTCDVKITFSIHYGEHEIWNHKDAPKLASWQEHQGHDTQLSYEFVPDLKNETRARPKFS
jgi:hypothetical protein